MNVKLKTASDAVPFDNEEQFDKSANSAVASPDDRLEQAIKELSVELHVRLPHQLQRGMTHEN